VSSALLSIVRTAYGSRPKVGPKSLQRALIEQLPTVQRLALAYAPAQARDETLALLSLDVRLAAILRSAREPMLAQLRLAWWREQLRTDPAGWPKGEPLLAILQRWSDRRDALIGLVDGWEAMTGPAPLPADAIEHLARARGTAFAALAELAGDPECAERAGQMGSSWALADLAMRLRHPEEQRAARSLAEAVDRPRNLLPRSMRPLAVMHGLARRSLRHADGQGSSLGAILTAMRLGLLGR
jgi:phytoene synthase